MVDLMADSLAYLMAAMLVSTSAGWTVVCWGQSLAAPLVETMAA